MLIRYGCIIAVLLGMCMLPAAQAADLAREARIAEQIEDAILDGEVIRLRANDHDFINILTETNAEQALGTVVLLHGPGQHPDWSDVISPLRQDLVNYGWHTLSVQMPVLDADARFKQYAPMLPHVAPRFEAVMRYLHEQRHETNIVIVAHSCGANMAWSWLKDKRQSPINGFVGISMGVHLYARYWGEQPPSHRLGLPVLDVYGSDDVTSYRAEERAMQVLEGNPLSGQVEIADTDAWFIGKEPELVMTVGNWLNQLPTAAADAAQVVMLNPPRSGNR